MPELRELASSRARPGRTLLVPVGATEQHGPHLPLTTDTDIAVAVAYAAARRGQGVDVAPAVAYGSSGEHQAFAGTLSIGAAATELLLLELVRSATCTWSRVVLVTTHGGNLEPVSAAVAQARSEGRDVRAWWPRWDGDAHAGHVETSLMLAIDPDRVLTREAALGAVEPVARLLPQMRAGGVESVSPNGILGDARTATAAAGRDLMETAIEALVTSLATDVTP